MSPVGDPEVVWAYRTYMPMLQQKCRRILADEAEAQDVAQESFTRLWRSRLDLHDTDHVVAWLYTTATRLAIDRLRRTRRVAPDPAPRPSEAPSPHRIAAARAELARVARALPAADLELLILWRIDGLRQSEIADLLGLGERTVRRRLARAAQRLARLGGSRA